MKKKKAARKNLFQPFVALSHIEKLFILAVGAAFVISYLVSFATTRYGSIFSRSRIGEYEVGKVAEQDLIVDQDIQFEDQEATRIKREAAAALVPPVFRVEDEITQRSIDRFQQLMPLLKKFSDENTAVQTALLEIQSSLPGTFEEQTVEKILRYENLASLLPTAESVFRELMTTGYFSIPSDLSASLPSSILVERWIEGNREIQEVDVSDILTAETLKSGVTSFTDSMGLDQGASEAIADIVIPFFEENAFYDEDATDNRRQRVMTEVDPVTLKLIKGERIVRKGFIVNEADMKKIRALGSYSVAVNVNALIGMGLYLAVLYSLGAYLLSRTPSNTKMDMKTRYLILGLTVAYHVIALVVFNAVPAVEGIPVTLFLPTALVAMLVTILTSHRIGIYMTVLLSLSLFAYSADAYGFLFALLSGFGGAIAVREARQRLDLIRASLLSAGINIVAALIIGFFTQIQISSLLVLAGWGIVNGIACGVLNLGFLPFFEHILNAATPFRLMELSDMNSPVLKRMLVLAPGTYTHSVNVANLAESACREIGADPLLARVGAFYHDIGKIDQAEYFIENQTESNKHDELKPSLSVAVIKSHVKIGTEKAKDLGLPQVVVDIVSQHHGSGLISYFYSRALEQNSGNVAPEDFSYSGIPPTSREAAVVMLADSVEAASRTLKQPTIAKLEKFVWKTMLDKVTNQQMINCELTFRDLMIVKETFIHILASQFHTRIEYPDVEAAKAGNEA